MKKIILGLIFSLIVSVAYAGDYVRLEQTTTPINSGVVYTSSVYETLTLESMNVNITSDQDSAVGGMDINYADYNGPCSGLTPTASNMDYTANSVGWDYTASTKNSYSSIVRGNCAWIVYTNGGTNQTTFKMTIFGETK